MEELIKGRRGLAIECEAACRRSREAKARPVWADFEISRFCWNCELSLTSIFFLLHSAIALTMTNGGDQYVTQRCSKPSEFCYVQYI